VSLAGYLKLNALRVAVSNFAVGTFKNCVFKGSTSSGPGGYRGGCDDLVGGVGAV